MTNAVEISNLRKDFGRHCALKNINLNVPQGTICGLLGPNGAGKTSLIKTLVGALKPTAGTVKVLGLDPLHDKWKLRQQIGYMPQINALYDDLSAKNNVLFFGGSRKIPDLDKKAAEMLAFTKLTSRSNDLVRTFSGGMKKRVSLCCALIHRPKLVFLDEPTAAIDPQLKLESWHLFRQLANAGTTLFISTHLMDEALLCDKLTILRNGEIIAVDSPQKILNMGKMKLRYLEGGETREGIIDSDPESLARELHRLGLRHDITSISVQPDSIEDIVLGIIGSNEKGDIK